MAVKMSEGTNPALQHLGNTRFALILWPILIGESIWFFASYLPRRMGWRE
jgi:hypothetical protein